MVGTMKACSLDDMLARLLAVTPDGFLDERKKIAAELKSSGRADEARDIAARKKPSPAVFAVNRLRDSASVKELAKAGESVRSAAQRILSGDDAAAVKDLAAAQRAQQVVVRSATQEGERLLSTDGYVVPVSARPKIEDTLRALSTLGQVARIGLLFEEVEPPDMAKIALLLSFSGEDAAPRGPSEPESPEPAVEPSVGSGRVISFADSKKVRDERRESERKMSDAKAEARAKREALDRAKGDAQQGQRRMTAVREAATRADSKVEALTAELAAATTASASAREAASRAEDEVRTLEAAVEAATEASRVAADALQTLQDRDAEG